MKLNKDDIKAIIGTTLFHVILLILFIFFGFRTPLPLPEEQGIEVNLGYSDQGMGDIQPETPPVKKNTPNQNISDDTKNITTQNTEETVKLNNKTETESKPEEPKKPEIDVKSMYQSKHSETGNEGETGKPGDQGNPFGSLNAKNHYGEHGNGGNGISFSLKGRKSKYLPKPNYTSNDEGTVVITITVNRKGEVIKAIAGTRGTTTTSSILWKLALKAALKSQFTQDINAAQEQKGTITYHFIKLK